jgi:hypothetical protein
VVTWLPRSADAAPGFFVVICGSHLTWDDENWQVLAGRQVSLVRDVGALSVLPLDLHRDGRRPAAC